MLRSLGFDHVIDYTQEDFTKNEQRYDLILDVKTNRSILDYLRVLSAGWRLRHSRGLHGSAHSSLAAGAVDFAGEQEASTPCSLEAEQGL